MIYVESTFLFYFIIRGLLPLLEKGGKNMYYLTKNGNIPNLPVKEFVCDSVIDIDYRVKIKREEELFFLFFFVFEIHLFYFLKYQIAL